MKKIIPHCLKSKNGEVINPRLWDCTSLCTDTTRELNRHACGWKQLLYFWTSWLCTMRSKNIGQYQVKHAILNHLTWVLSRRVTLFNPLPRPPPSPFLSIGKAALVLFPPDPSRLSLYNSRWKHLRFGTDLEGKCTGCADLMALATRPDTGGFGSKAAGRVLKEPWGLRRLVAVMFLVSSVSWLFSTCEIASSLRPISF